MSEMKLNTIIWDWNGTLLDDVDLCVQTINRLLVREGLRPLADKTEYQRVFQFPIQTYYEKAGFDFNRCSFDSLAQAYMDDYQPHSLACSLQEHAVDVLRYFHEQGYTQVLLSASKRDFLLMQLKQYPIQSYFRDILGLDNIYAHSKLDLAKQYFQQNGAQMASVWFIGDSVHDNEVAKAVNAKCVLVANGHEHWDKLTATGAIVIDDLSGLPAIIDRKKPQ